MKNLTPQIRRSRSKASFDLTNSPYTPQLIVKNILNPSRSLKQKESFSRVSETVLENCVRNIKRRSTLALDTKKIEEDKAKHLESLLYERLATLKTGKQFKNELEVLDSIYSEVAAFVETFEHLLLVLREKMEKCIAKRVEDCFSEKIDRIKVMNESLVKKINTLTDMHQGALKENNELKRSLEGYERIFKQTPGVIVNYENIVDKMIVQCNVIEKQCKEIEKLKKSQIMSLQVINELKVKNKKSLDLSF